MEKEYWEQFFKTGKIKDYLYYKGIAICRQVMARYTMENTLPDDDRQELFRQE